MKDDQRTFILTFSISFLCHLVFFTILIFLPDHVPAKKYVPSVINVSMVAAPMPRMEPEPSGKPRIPEKVPDKPAAVKQEPEAPSATVPDKNIQEQKVQEPEPQKEPAPKLSTENEKAVSIAPKKIKPKKSLKKGLSNPPELSNGPSNRFKKKQRGRVLSRSEMRWPAFNKKWIKTKLWTV